MQVFVKTLTGKTITCTIGRAGTVDDIKNTISQQLSIPADGQVLMYNAKCLQDGQYLMNYNITPNSTLHLALRLRGMISSFGHNDTTDPLIRFLMLSDNERQTAIVPIDRIRKKAESERAKRFQTFSLVKKCGILNDVQQKLFTSFMQFMWDSTANDCPPDRVDMRLVFPDKEFLELLGLLDCTLAATSSHVSKRVLQAMQDAYRQVPGATDRPKLALRMTCGPTKACINFHCDGSYATSTSQIALNSEYNGGKLCYFVNDAIHILDRPTGSLVQHPPNVLHGVTSLTSGKRMSLFIVDHKNGLGEEHIIEISQTHLSLFLADKVMISIT